MWVNTLRDFAKENLTNSNNYTLQNESFDKDEFSHNTLKSITEDIRYKVFSDYRNCEIKLFYNSYYLDSNQLFYTLYYQTHEEKYYDGWDFAINKDPDFKKMSDNRYTKYEYSYKRQSAIVDRLIREYHFENNCFIKTGIYAYNGKFYVKIVNQGE